MSLKFSHSLTTGTKTLVEVVVVSAAGDSFNNVELDFWSTVVAVIVVSNKMLSPSELDVASSVLTFFPIHPKDSKNDIKTNKATFFFMSI